ncbi:bifunctional 4-hydroxy-2-oxoglutarate aldolase/2-dehydro-3-deoxy-phosphogluconate aldolase [Parapedobacter sp. 10938]|uniref:bifunctional 4-hydroxy-2-oxoglutarate aldolase/2-dehydro-3-deoxy-phosphogluconate aldolase n=1 Tax=Parapedobacter flavus TaxID=3110225 RepID=UPI002DB9B55A|nr:bifunctional 4-hydroxy-2-oxoglutarate aldolase/2-dehydro-3-deoxy-phosphogluconate aldolase [Parapedobacter sp. 10938]MEC3879178.1 bifunctional 4-hydroxy-2-oxoglutarate aldolase/2-dehydro-3-deoxy-phosphogluconate aldolase [Parapedobacter sp. 10938]
MTKKEIIAKIEAERLIAIVRLAEEAEVLPTVARLVASGVRVLEITSNTPGYGEAIQQARERFPEVLIGAGTILNDTLASEALSYGAQFLVTPNTNVAVIATAHRAGTPVVMGALTPTEVAEGINHGADFIKLFPASAMGPAYLKALLGPYNGIRMIAVGGVDFSNADDWFRAGAVGVGMGGSLLSDDPSTIGQSIAKLHTFRS